MKTLKLFATLRDLAGQKTIDVPFTHGQTVRKLVEDITQINPALGAEILDENGDLSGAVHILVHGRNCEWLNGLDTTIKETDIVTLVPPVAGG